MNLTRVLAAAALAAAMVVPSASAQTAAPVPGCGLVSVDPADDSTSQIPTAVRPKPGALEIERAFFDHTDGVTTVNIQVLDLSTALPVGTTSLHWTTQWVGADGVTRFVRAVTDYTGQLIFEHGELVPPIGGLVLPRYEAKGATTGTLFTGPHGVVQIVIPPSVGGAAGTKLTGIYSQASDGRTVVPNAAPTPSRGLSTVSDRVPDSPDTATWTVKGCL